MLIDRAKPKLGGVPTPVGPLGPGEFDPNDPDLWDWDAEPESLRRPLWIRVTAWVIGIAFVTLVLLSVFR